MSELEIRRDDFERQLAESRQLLKSEIGTYPRKPVWVVPLLAGVVGLSAAMAFRKGYKTFRRNTTGGALRGRQD